ncbi:MAG: inorganic phosphate transporter [Thermoplasmata archaeon]
MIAPGAILLLVLAFGFAFALGAHYAGACMGMADAAQATSRRRLLLIMAPLTFLGAALAGERVETTVGHDLLLHGHLPIPLAASIIGVAFLLTALFTVLRIPVSVTQIVIFASVGTGLAAGLSIEWGTVGVFVLIWALTPLATGILGYLLVRTLHRRWPVRALRAMRSPPALMALVGLGALTSFMMGANDVSNATGALLLGGLSTATVAALVGGLGLGLGAFLFGDRLIDRMAREVVDLDPPMAASAQLAQSTVLLGVVLFGFYTSLNQALLGALLGVGYGRHRSRIRWTVVRHILVEWGTGPLTAAALAAATTLLLRWTGLG